MSDKMEFSLIWIVAWAVGDMLLYIIVGRWTFSSLGFAAFKIPFMILVGWLYWHFFRAKTSNKRIYTPPRDVNVLSNNVVHGDCTIQDVTVISGRDGTVVINPSSEGEDNEPCSYCGSNGHTCKSCGAPKKK